MWDTFNNSNPIEFIDFKFKSFRFEVWAKSKMVDSGFTDNIITLEKSILANNEIGLMKNTDFKIEKYVSHQIDFDLFLPINDRLTLFSISEVGSGTSECDTFSMIKQIYGSTRYIKNYDSNIPFACSLYLQNSIIKKITFSTCNPSRLIEFYSS